MNHEQLLAHYALMGWEAWLEDDGRYNISRSGAGTYWTRIRHDAAGYSPEDMYGLRGAHTTFERTLELHEIPEAVFLRLAARVEEEGHGS